MSLVAKYRKFLVAVVGAASEALTLGLVHGTVAHWVTIGIGIATALGIYAVPNAPSTPIVPLPPS